MKKYYTLYIARNEAGESTADAGALIGVKKSAYWAKENGINAFSLPEAFKLAKHYDMPVDELFKETPFIQKEVS
ncbi:helix-turn-helix transcriptional regulator [Salinicoccus sesuvii]|uniref:Helix-turn-helix transcriptional regulator n=1 Tax=Salinicoccus sesuvii TaxID=868281 RepID=A0ABV7N9K5_9STAP